MLINAKIAEPAPILASARQAWDSQLSAADRPTGIAPTTSRRRDKKKTDEQQLEPFRLTPPPRPQQHLESKLQQQLVSFFRSSVSETDAILAAIPNGGPRKGIIGILVAEGMLSGWPDLIMLIRGGIAVGIEVKLAKAFGQQKTGLTGEQPKLFPKLRALGHRVYVVRTLEELWAIVDHYAVPHRFRPTSVRRLPPGSLPPTALLD
jgi:hypothetical protein